MDIKHSKIRNTSILFEILVRQITADTLSGADSPALNILKKYFSNTELGKEYKLYETVLKNRNISEGKANTIISTVLESSKKLNHIKLKKEKYNIIKELKAHYNLEDLLKTRLKDYKTQAALYILFESYNNNTNNTNQIINNKVTLLEHLTQSVIDKDNVRDSILEEFKNYDKDLRILTYKILLEKFNSKYSSLNNKQKNILKEFIESIDSSSNLKNFYNTEINNIKEEIEKHIEITTDKTTQIKLQEILKLTNPLSKNDSIKNNHLVDLLQFHNLLEELNKVNY
jgi:hypothetical protein